MFNLNELCVMAYENAAKREAKDGKVSTCLFDGEYFDCGSDSGYALANVYVVYNNQSSKSSTVSKAISSTQSTEN